MYLLLSMLPGTGVSAQGISIRSRNLDSLAVLADTYLAANKQAEAIKVFRRMGNVSRESNAFMEAVRYHNRALTIAEATNNQDEIILCLNQIGTDYRRIGAYEEATTYHYRALQCCEEYRGESDFALKNRVMSLNGIGNIYLMLNNPDEAEAAFRRALAGETQLESHLGMAINYANLGAIFEMRQQYDSARVYYEQSMTQNRLADSQLGIALCHNYFGHLAERDGDYTTALREYHAAYDIMERTTDRWHWLESCLAIVRVNIAKGDMQTAALYLGDAERVSRSVNSKDYLAAMYEMKYRYFEKKGDWRQALESYISAKQYADSTLNLTNVNHINNLRMLYETEKKEIRITTLENERRLILWLSVVGGIVLLLALVTFFFLWRWTVQKKRLAEQRMQLVATQAVLDGEVQERIRLARDLHDGLGSILAATKYNLADIKKEFPSPSDCAERYDTAMTLLDDSMREMRRIAHHLMPEALSEVGLKQSVADFCNNVPHVKFTYYGDESGLNPKLEVMVYRIMHELVSNALKHANARHILVEIARDADSLFLTVQDDGQGFDISLPSEGMGLSNIRNRVTAYQGNVDIHSVTGEGTEVNITIPLSTPTA
jgi:signal transduction histidine kinase